ncbi:hypothetical protein J7I93_02690 [Bacillus sp. ISL-47]|uniref:hypothetical protein n=1 Tax=Bacillus sp. ISL-47 TaxID=2819130 RepID=UPI001BE8CF2D|nr:hypothetical protein [Bacillus sp. ISL-47]MBT2687085.1 hypothetical protein [Bacillus sp. ISL-47]MBT2707385.1 hypothetical protein [Pseudomonas sp. ISL-84]
MKFLYGVEANYIVEDVPEFMDFIKKETELFDFQRSIFLFENDSDAELAKNLLIESNLIEGSSLLYYITNGEKGESFDDFGLESAKGFYLYPEMLCAFFITRGDAEDIQMAKYQFHEHLVFTAKDDDIGLIYFSELHLKDLINGIAEAYDIEVSFLDLDK